MIDADGVSVPVGPPGWLNTGIFGLKIAEAQRALSWGKDALAATEATSLILQARYPALTCTMVAPDGRRIVVYANACYPRPTSEKGGFRTFVQAGKVGLLAQSGDLSIGGVITQIVSGGAGGAILTAIVGALKARAA
ncbi:hypothetical protein [Paracraurococcus lichenis]|uniref:Uncharacterized protein n=1 Tax=Paracraurococcus lichenis TaxID=3064888 RepID=A0ABT9EC66_9PROT|nr:hypothetical protein [Paracraurococcus sp. LOR1-02]MDO9713806.1 hypothetical protein [Paracraurococcus sp. LOR1-02]